MSARAVQTGIFIITALLLVDIVYLWHFSYFWLDDFNNLYWVQRQSGWSMLGNVVNPASDFFRPFGMLCYWILFKLFHLNALSYHILAWTLHAANATLLYILLSRIVESRFAAAIGVVLFAFRSDFADIYWSFGFIFELLACFLMLFALLLHIKQKKSVSTILVILVIAILAIKSKEMAITLAAVLVFYDICFSKRPDRTALIEFCGLAVITLWFVQFKLLAMRGDSLEHPYYMDLSVLTFGRGYGWYFDRLFRTPLRWGAWMSISSLLFLWMLYKRERRGIFFLGYTFITLLPVIFLVNHRGEFYWYIPFFGFAGLVAVGTHALCRRLQKWTGAAPVLGFVAFVVLTWWRFSVEKEAVQGKLQWEKSISSEYSSFVRQLSNLPPPNPPETIHYRGIPTYFNLDTLTAATQLAFRSTNIMVDVVDEFPSPCRYCLDFQNGILRQVQ
jgi:hypothetical protein